MTNSQTPDHESGLTFLSHLVELRDRLLRIVLVVAVVFGVLALVSNDLYTLLAKPLLAYMPKGSGMIATEVSSSFFVPIKLALVAAVFISMPYILYQIWAFVAPALYSHEKRLILPLLVGSITLFYCGISFAYFVVSPIMFEFFFATTPEGVAMMTDIGSYLDFVLTIFFAFGLAFEVPIATILLVWMGVVTPEGLAEKRPYVVVGIFLVAAVLTPPDPLSQTLLAVPMWILFESGLFFSRAFVKHRRNPDDEIPVEGENMDETLDRYESDEESLRNKKS
ncbi:MAG TPA: twin-arginine translocase subunit TatC [Gammaproteobacteria bacterium]